MNKVD
jgi:hypothetical protein